MKCKFYSGDNIIWLNNLNDGSMLETVHQSREQWPPGGIRFALVGTGAATGVTGETILDFIPRASVEIASPSIIGLVTEIINKSRKTF